MGDERVQLNDSVWLLIESVANSHEKFMNGFSRCLTLSNQLIVLCTGKELATRLVADDQQDMDLRRKYTRAILGRFLQ